MPWETWIAVPRLSDDLEAAWSAAGVRFTGFRAGDADTRPAYRIRYDRLARARRIMRDWQLTRTWWGRWLLRLRTRRQP